MVAGILYPCCPTTVKSRPSIPSTMYEYEASLRRVVDGDTADLDIDTGFHHHAHIRIRLLGINTPELRSKNPTTKSLAIAAKNRLYQLLSDNPTFTVQTTKPDSFGRWLGNITLPGMTDTVSSILLSEGLAKRYEP